MSLIPALPWSVRNHAAISFLRNTMSVPCRKKKTYLIARFLTRNAPLIVCRPGSVRARCESSPRFPKLPIWIHGIGNESKQSGEMEREGREKAEKGRGVRHGVPALLFFNFMT